MENLQVYRSQIASYSYGEKEGWSHPAYHGTDLEFRVDTFDGKTTTARAHVTAKGSDGTEMHFILGSSDVKRLMLQLVMGII